MKWLFISKLPDQYLSTAGVTFRTVPVMEGTFQNQLPDLKWSELAAVSNCFQISNGQSWQLSVTAFR